MLKCNSCGNIFDVDELATWTEDRGECHGRRAYETLDGCPYCFSGDYEQYHDDEDGDDGERGL